MSLTYLIPHITHYMIVNAADPERLHKEIETAIHNGWQPHGSLAVDRDGDKVHYVQPMARYAEFHR